MMAVRREADRATAAHATVRHGSLSLELRPGEELTFGRGADRDIRIGHDPTDDLVSRAAGSILGLVDGALVRNTSRTQSLTFIAMPGPSFVLRPKVAIGTMPHGRVRFDHAADRDCSLRMLIVAGARWRALAGSPGFLTR